MKSPTEESLQPQRTKKQNHANIPCPIEDCARFTYGKLPDHLTKRHGLVGAERDAVNERQRKRFFNGELCQVRYLRESAVAELWGDDYNNPRIRQKVMESFALVKIRIIPIAACAKDRPLMPQDANVLTEYNARVEQKIQKATRRKAGNRTTAVNDNKRRKSVESSEGEENLTGSSSPAVSSETPTVESRIPVAETVQIHFDYKNVINDMEKSMTMGRPLSEKKQKLYRTYRRYAKRLLAFLYSKCGSSEFNADILLCNEEDICEFMNRTKNECKPKSARNYIVAAIKLMDSRLFRLETDPNCRDKVAIMTKVYSTLHKILKEFQEMIERRVNEDVQYQIVQ